MRTWEGRCEGEWAGSSDSEWDLNEGALGGDEDVILDVVKYEVDAARA